MQNPPVRSGPVWPLPQRLIHWGLVLGFGLAWWSSEGNDALHEWSGYALAALVAARVALGFGKHPAADWDVFFAKLARLPAALAGRGGAYAGLSPTGAASALVLLVLMLATTVTGWMLTLDAFVGDEGAELRHIWSFNLLQGWVALHVLAVLFVSLRQRRNRIAAMILGGRREADHPRQAAARD